MLFAQLSYQQVGSAAVLSRATAGIKRDRKQLVVALPGSSKACSLAVDDILLPELAHIIGHMDK
jgi:molybdenum cofactor biosynthesis protein B